MKNLFAMLRDDSGATMVEYSIMVVMIAAVCIIVITTLGKTVSGEYSSVNAAL